jgi:hypothetical protein
MRLQFKKPLPEKIKRGQKIHTLREDLKRRWREGMMIDFVEGSRYKPTVFLSEAVSSIQEVKLIFFASRVVIIRIDDRELSPAEIQDFIKNDGFDSEADFRAFFKDFLSIELRLIHWTDLKY